MGGQTPVQGTASALMGGHAMRLNHALSTLHHL